MKKIYTLIALAFAAMSASADVVLTLGGEVCDPSKTVEVLAVEENYGDETDPWIQIGAGQTDPKLKNTSSSNASISVTVITDDWKNFTWCFPDQCMPLTAKETTKSHTLTAGEEKALTLDASFGGFDEDYNPIWGPDCYKSMSASVTIKEGSKSTTYNLDFVYDERSSCGVFPGGADGIDTVLSTTTDAPRYDLQGRRTNSTAHGIFLKGGRKFIQK